MNGSCEDYRSTFAHSRPNTYRRALRDAARQRGAEERERERKREREREREREERGEGGREGEKGEYDS